MANTILLLGASSQLRPLEAVADEIRNINEIFNAAESELVRIVYEPLLIRDGLGDILRRHANEVSIIHFAGHSGERELLTDDGLVFSCHIADILRTWDEKPDLIFLNGCNNAGQVQSFLDAGVRSVIATYDYIDDDLASGFSQAFYENLLAHTGTVSLAHAFSRAESTALFSENRKARSLDLADLPKIPEQWDWGLFSAYPEFTHQWSLQNTVFTAPLSWVSNKGEDDYGGFAEINLDGVIQRFRRLQHSETNAVLWMADSACAQALWQAVMGKNPAEFDHETENPVERVNWWDVQDFLSQLNEKIPGLQARLPTEAEWEWACRAGTETAYTFGDVITREQVNYNGEATVRVKSLPANAWGLYEMHGNIWEWCEDDADDRGNRKVLRGGSWADEVESVRSDSRGRNILGNRDYTIGFRFLIADQ